MTRANIVLPDGTKVSIEGTADEVARLLTQFSGPSSGAKKAERKKASRKTASRESGGSKTNRKGPQVLIGELLEEGFFKSKRTIKDIQKKLEERGHIYAQTSLSSPLLRLTKNRTLRRMKEKVGWVYVN